MNDLSKGFWRNYGLFKKKQTPAVAVFYELVYQRDTILYIPVHKYCMAAKQLVFCLQQ